MMLKNYNQMVTFYYVANLNSFSKASQVLGISKAHVSNQITQLEKAMQTKLLERTTRRLKLTVAGEQLYEHSRKIVIEFQAAEQSIALLQDAPRGLLRVTAPPAYAAHILSDKLPHFLHKYPNIQLSLNLTSEAVDLFEEKIDIAIRLTHTPPLDRVAKRIGQYQMQICASTDYCNKNKIASAPYELTLHPCIIYSTEKINARWPFVMDGQEKIVDITASLACNSYEIAMQAVLNGCGVARLPSYVIKEEVEKNNIKVLFAEYMPTEIPIYAIYSQTKFMPPRVKVFIEFLLTQLLGD